MRINCDLGILHQEILETALHEYMTQCLCDCNHSRADEVKKLMDLLLPIVSYGSKSV